MNEIRGDLSSLPGIRAFPVMRQGSAAVPASRCNWCSAAPHTKSSPPGATSSSRRSRRTIPARRPRQRLQNPPADRLQRRLRARRRPRRDRRGDRPHPANRDGRAQRHHLSRAWRGIRRDRRRRARAATLVQRPERHYVRSARSGQLIPLANLVTISEYGAAETLSRFNRVRAITLEANPCATATRSVKRSPISKSWCARTCPKK